MATHCSSGDGKRSQRLASAFVLTVLGSTGCVDALHGSNIQVDFSSGTSVPATAPGETPGSQPWADTYYAFYGVDNVYEVDAEGDEVLDTDGKRIVLRSYVFEVERFQVQPVINLASPCFMEDEGSRFPGLHSTQYLNRLEEDVGFTDPFNAPAGADNNDVIDLLTADVRMKNMVALAGQVKAVTTYSTREYPAIGTDCVEDGGGADVIPPIDCIGDESNDVRYARCQDVWNEPDPSCLAYGEASTNCFYEGNDKVLTLPHNGRWRGGVTGTNPINDGFIGGTSFITNKVLSDIDALTVNWQFKDHDEDGEPDYPADFPDERKSPVGVIYLRGDVELDARGVLNVPMFNPEDIFIRAEATIFPDLGQDDVHF